VSKVLGCEPCDFELILVDQSDGPETAQALSLVRSDQRFRYLSSATRGAAAARNVGIEHARGDIVAFTDDDCIVAPDWVRGILRVFESDEELDVMFGRVSAPGIPPGTWAATFAASLRQLPASGYPPFPDGWGISANLACRRRVFDKIGRFDPLLGPGSPLKAAEDFDLFIRMRKAGLKIINAEEVCVDHVGFRGDWALRKLMSGYYFSTGAALVKHVRMGDAALLGVLAQLGAKVFVRMCKRLVRLRGRGEMMNLAFLIGGALTSFRYRIDYDRQLYIARAPEAQGGA
jgi:glycosyltransferase involved in cell wall biosynthesis